MFRFLYESPLWLLSQGRMDKAEAVIKRMSIMNRRPIPPSKLIQLKQFYCTSEPSDQTKMKRKKKKNENTESLLAKEDLPQQVSLSFYIKVVKFLWLWTKWFVPWSCTREFFRSHRLLKLGKSIRLHTPLRWRSLIKDLIFVEVYSVLVFLMCMFSSVRKKC